MELTLFIELRQVMASASVGVDWCLTSFILSTSYNVCGAQIYPTAVSRTESENKTKKIPQFSLTLLGFSGWNFHRSQMRQLLRIQWCTYSVALLAEGFLHCPQASIEKTFFSPLVSNRLKRIYRCSRPISYISHSPNLLFHLHRAVHHREHEGFYLLEGLPGCRYFGSLSYKLQLPSWSACLL